MCRNFGLQKTSYLLAEVSSIDLRRGSLGFRDRAATWTQQFAENQNNRSSDVEFGFLQSGTKRGSECQER
jgi:hypothetical protein